MPLVLTGQQREVLDALKGKETEKYPLSHFYLGALYALDNNYNPDRISQAAQSLRELLEKLPRVVREMDSHGHSHDFKGMRRGLHDRLSKDKMRYNGEWKGEEIDAKLDKTLRKIDYYLELNQQPTRREAMQLTIAAIDPMAGQLDSQIRQAKRDELHKLWGILEGFAHHKSKPDIEEFIQCLGILERIVFDLLAPITAQDQNEIQEILTRSDKSENDVERMLSLIERRGANFAFFFEHATDASWIPILKKRGYFAQLPKEETFEDGRVIFPFWRPILYLKRVSATDACLVVDTILDLQNTDNPRILQTIAEVALKVEPIEQSLRLKGLVSKYLQSPYSFGVSDFIPKLVIRWAGASTKATKAALNLMRRAASFETPETQYKQALHRAYPEHWITSLGPWTRFHEWEYEEILEKGGRAMAEQVPYQTARILTYATAEMLSLKYPKDAQIKVAGNDYSMSWCRRVNVSTRNYPNPKEALVHALTFACEKVYEKEPESVSALEKVLRNQHWEVFRRIRQHLYALHPNKQTKPWIRKLILTHNAYDQRGYYFEFQRMIRLSCEKLGPDLLTETEKKQIFDAILCEPSNREFHRIQLRPFEPVLFGKYRKYFKELKAEEEAPITDDSYPPYIPNGAYYEMVKDRSPKPIEELKKLSDEELLLFLNEWENHHDNSEDWSIDINFTGLAEAFQSVFKKDILPEESRLEFWIEKNRECIERPIYVRVMISAIHELVESKQFDKLDEWFDFCEWVLLHPDRPKEVGINRSEESRRYPDWQSARRTVGDFVGMCLKKEVNLPITGRKGLASLLDKLCTQYDSGLDEEKPVILNQDDQFDEAINNTRSRALDNLVDFGYWVRHQLEDNKADAPEVFSILEKRFNSECELEKTLPEYAILGQNYRSICGLNREWAVNNKGDFFPQDNLRAWVIAFLNFLSNPPYIPTFAVIREEIEFALDNLGNFKMDGIDTSNFTERLGIHLIFYYLLEVYPLTGDGSLLERFYQKTKAEKDHWFRLIFSVGIYLKKSEKQLQEGFNKKIIDFFDWRLKQQEPSELKEFTFWLEAECLDSEWRLTSLSKILDVCRPTGTKVSIQVDDLREMLKDHTALVVECFAKLTDIAVRTDESILFQTDTAKPILQAGLHFGDKEVQENAKRAHENLLKCGYSDLLDLEG